MSYLLTICLMAALMIAVVAAFLFAVGPITEWRARREWKQRTRHNRKG